MTKITSGQTPESRGIQGRDLVGEDGARDHSVEVAAFDSSLGTACTPEVAADGEVRCLPHDVQVSRGFAFADAACTQKMVTSADTISLGLIAERPLARASRPPARRFGAPPSV
jgi:hypothetical protein